VLIVIKIENCARCGENHDQVGFFKFTRELEVEYYRFTHYGFCPKVHEPILMFFTED
jgi:hypothetical protein